MASYISALSVDNATPSPVGSSLFGICSTRVNAPAKIVTLSNFDELRNGVTVHVKFTYGNKVALDDSLTLTVGSTSPRAIKNPGGSAAWPEGAIISFTYDGTNWCVNDGLMSSSSVLNTYNPTSEEAISGKGVAAALTTLGEAAQKDVVETIIELGVGANKNSGDLPTTAAVTSYIDSKLGGEIPQNSVHFVGVTTTALTNGSDTSPIYINGEAYTPSNGDMVVAPSGLQYIWYEGSWTATGTESSVQYGTCNTQAAVAAKTVLVNDFALEVGATIYVKFTNANTAQDPTLNVSNSGALPITLYGSTNAGTNDDTDGWYAGAVISFTYDGTSWVRTQGYNSNNWVEQVEATGNHLYSLLLKNSFNFLDETNVVQYTDLITANPSTGIITANGFSGSGALLTNLDSSNMIFDNETIPNSALVNSSIEVAGRVWNLGDTISASTLRQDLNLNSALHFIGFSTVAITDGSTTNPRINEYDFGNEGANATAGDVIIDSDSEREYVWDGSQWELLGQDALSDVYELVAPTNKWIASITQRTDRSIVATLGELDTSVDWTGNAATATAWYYDRKIYADLSLASTAVTINGSDVENDDAIGIGIDGILNVANGGTGNDSFNVDEVILSNPLTTTGAFTSLPYTDTTAARALTTTQAFITERSIYYGLPQINHAHNYTSTDEIYAPTTSGDQYHVLLSRGTNREPEWSETVTLTDDISTTANIPAYNILTLGNNGKLNTSSLHAEGYIKLYSSMSHAHILNVAGTDIADYTHTFPNVDGWVVIGSTAGVGINANTLVYMNSSGELLASTLTIGSETQFVYLSQGSFVAATTAIGGEVQPIYIDDTGNITAIVESVGSAYQPIYLDAGNITAITFTANRLYYTYDTENFLPTLHYADTDRIAINSESRPTVNLYVNGTTHFADKVGIGTAPDSAQSGDQHVLTIAGSTLLSITNNSYLYNVAHLDVSLSSGISSTGVLEFYPETSGTGYIGTSASLWKEAHISDSVNVVDGTNDIILAAGVVTIDGPAPTLIIDNTDTNGEPWTIISDTLNTASLFKIYNDSGDTYIYGSSGAGFEITPVLYINETVPASPDHTLYVNGTGKFVDQVGIGVDADDTAYLSVLDYICLVNDTSDPIVHLINDSTYGLQFYPESDTEGTLGIANAKRWNSLYLYHGIEVSDSYGNTGADSIYITTEYNSASNAGTSILSLESEPSSGNPTLSINMQTGKNLDTTLTLYAENGTSESILSLVSGTPKIILDTTVSNKADWTISNNPDGMFYIEENGVTNTATLCGVAAHGFSISPALFVNADVDVTSTHSLYVYGTTYLDGLLTVNGDVYPDITNTYSLGCSDYKWSALFVGTEDTYGDPYEPIYWNNGVPATVAPVQYITWAISASQTSISLTHEAYTSDTFVISLVVTGGESNLNAPITWNTNTNGTLKISTSVAPSGTVSGYVITARGIDLDN